MEHIEWYFLTKRIVFDVMLLALAGITLYLVISWVIYKIKDKWGKRK